MSFDKRAIPGRITRSGGKNAGRIVVGGIAGPGNNIAVAGPEPRIVGAVLREYLEVQMASQVEKPLESNPAEGLVADARARQGYASARQVGGRSDANHGITPD